MRELDGLEPGERLRATASVSFRAGVTTMTTKNVVKGSSVRARYDRFEVWQQAAEAVGFPTAGPDMIVGITDTRLLVWGKSPFLGRVTGLAGAMPLHRIAQVSAVRHGFLTGLALVVGGTIVELEAMRGRRLRRIAHEVQTALAQPPS